MGYFCDSCKEELHLDENGFFVGKDNTSDCSADPLGHLWNGQVGA